MRRVVGSCLKFWAMSCHCLLIWQCHACYAISFFCFVICWAFNCFSLVWFVYIYWIHVLVRCRSFTSVFKSLPWLNIPEWKQYKVLLLTYSTLQSCNLLSSSFIYSPTTPLNLPLIHPNNSLPFLCLFPKFGNHFIAIANPPFCNKLSP